MYSKTINFWYLPQNIEMAADYYLNVFYVHNCKLDKFS